MTKGHGKWTTFVTYCYYVVGSFYYFYHWFLILGFSGLMVAIGRSLGGDNGVVITVISSVLSVTAILLGIAFWRRLTKLQLTSLNPCLRISSLSIEYTIIDQRNCDYTREIEAQACYPVDHYTAKFLWSAMGSATPHVLHGVQTMQLTEHPASVDTVITVPFERALAKKERYKFGYRIALREGTRSIKPFFGHTVDGIVKLLTLRVIFHVPVSRFKKQLFASRSTELPLWEEVVEINGGFNQAEWRVEHPKTGYYYRISW